MVEKVRLEMTQKELSEFVERFFTDQKMIIVSKGTSYSGATNEVEDRLANFKRIASELGVSPLFVWFVYFKKHVDAVCTYVRCGQESEPIRSRFLDLAGYALLGAALVEEKKV